MTNGEYYEAMSNTNVKDFDKRLSIKVPLSEEESDQFSVFLKKTGRKAAPFVKSLILEAMAKEGARA